MRSEIQTETAPEFHSNDNFPSSAKHASDASHALYAGSYATSSASQMSRTLSLHSVQSGISSSQRDSSEPNSHYDSSDEDRSSDEGGSSTVYNGSSFTVYDATDNNSSDTDSISYAESDRANSYCVDVRLANEKRTETPATLSRFPKALELIKNELPDLALEAALEGRDSVYVLSQAAKRGRGSDPYIDEQIRLAIAGIEAQGFGAAHVLLPISPCERVATVKAYWDSDHRPDLVKVQADVLRQKRLDVIAARPPEPDHCANVYKDDIVEALEDGRLPDALELLQSCATAADSKGDPAIFKDFVRDIDTKESHQYGLDLKLHYGRTLFNNPFNDGFEIE